MPLVNEVPEYRQTVEIFENFQFLQINYISFHTDAFPKKNSASPSKDRGSLNKKTTKPDERRRNLCPKSVGEEREQHKFTRRVSAGIAGGFIDSASERFARTGSSRPRITDFTRGVICLLTLPRLALSLPRVNRKFMVISGIDSFPPVCVCVNCIVFCNDTRTHCGRGVTCAREFNQLRWTHESTDTGKNLIEGRLRSNRLRPSKKFNGRRNPIGRVNDPWISRDLLVFRAI